LGQDYRVKCYYCDGSLSGWETNENIFVEHAKCVLPCEYLLQQKGFTFVFGITSGFPNLYPPLSRRLGQPVLPDVC